VSEPGAGTFRATGEREVYAGHIIKVAVGSFEGPDGSTFTRDIVHHPGAVAVVPVLDDGTVVLVRQFRAPLGTDVLEIPAGIRDVDGEPLEETAQRELAEEVGYRAGRLELLVSFQNSPGFCDEVVHVFLGTGLTATELSLQSIEEQHMTIEHVPLAKARELIGSGAIADAKTVIGLLLAADRVPSPDP
jgi:ADP-ribose pyrophosphatase